jgi:hypothetical protein
LKCKCDYSTSSTLRTPALLNSFFQTPESSNKISGADSVRTGLLLTLNVGDFGTTTSSEDFVKSPDFEPREGMNTSLKELVRDKEGDLGETLSAFGDLGGLDSFLGDLGGDDVGDLGEIDKDVLVGTSKVCAELALLVIFGENVFLTDFIKEARESLSFAFGDKGGEVTPCSLDIVKEVDLDLAGKL